MAESYHTLAFLPLSDIGDLAEDESVDDLVWLAVLLFVLLVAGLAPRFGVDSRDGFAASHRLARSFTDPRLTTGRRALNTLPGWFTTWENKHAHIISLWNHRRADRGRFGCANPATG
ncbi:MAG TPA: hypothetical protein VK457_08730 [Chloroflexota bacterium]|jgi:hypothetical protein|nr:hypothetical protein [Chloroflexota bacterium]